MPRSILEEALIHTAIRDKVAAYQRSIVQEVQAAVVAHAVVVVGMRVNPF
ncbi:MAG: glutaredoxin, partial [Ferruginibacter sp.]|nr:glutaredoxin [Rhodoferax sp.]